MRACRVLEIVPGWWFRSSSFVLLLTTTGATTTLIYYYCYYCYDHWHGYLLVLLVLLPLHVPLQRERFFCMGPLCFSRRGLPAEPGSLFAVEGGGFRCTGCDLACSCCLSGYGQPCVTKLDVSRGFRISGVVVQPLMKSSVQTGDGGGC